MFTWFAFGHMNPYLHLANKLAEKGHRVTFLLLKKAQKHLECWVTFLDKFLSEAMDLTRGQVEAAVRALRPDLIFFDFAHQVPEIAKEYMSRVCVTTYYRRPL